jgi:hypothetical protein
MSDAKKGKDSSKTEKPDVDESGKELTAEDLENVAGGLLPAVAPVADKWAPVNATDKYIGKIEGFEPALKK